ncbi:activating signal cointegrator 1 complex subunit 2 isoform X2 [Pseudomyrmex gracilis]|uniref:activating signal cointegrator 1 complex subunit 2 isoform X2 n=1 Tax=Pseudomyrmex gracilis TaxID=219809 RepID=UPI000995769B|nr:activating signal cointegrator 1 complex subunit 2 isoform X2 [Pseudomyrmex gracilis]
MCCDFFCKSLLIKQIDNREKKLFPVDFNARCEMDFYKNPNFLPLEELELHIKTDGVVLVKSALSPQWVEKRYFLHYEVPEIYDKDGSEIEGAKNHWLEITDYIIEDLNWLLGLRFHRFWSNIVFNTAIIDTLVSFLQEAPPFYALENFPTIRRVRENLEKLRYSVLMIFARLVTNKESPTEYMNNAFLGNLLYDNYIFTIPIIFDLCQLYGRENAKVMQKILQCLFDLQPMYNDDLQKSVPCLISALENVERRFDNSSIYGTEAVALSEQRNSIDMTLYNLEDVILYILDVSSTLTVLLRIYPSVIQIFHREDFMNKIVSLYGNTIPQMYQKLDKLALNDENMPKYIELKHRLDVTRIEMLELYRIIIYEPISNIREKNNTIPESELRRYIDEYLNTLINAISEKEFIIDYHRLYPIKPDLESLCKLCPEVDSIKHEYILQALSASIGDTTVVNEYSNDTSRNVGGSSSIQDSQKVKEDNITKRTKDEIKSKDTDEMSRLVSEVKEILCDYGEGFIQACLKHYDNNVEDVIHAVLDNTLPPTLQKLDTTVPYIPLDPQEVSAAVDLAVRDLQKLEFSNNDESNLTQYTDTSVFQTQKKKYKYRNAREMLDDKSEMKNHRAFYGKYSVVSDYDDEYDDTYDSHNIRGGMRDDSTEVDTKCFAPRVFRSYNKASSEDDENDNEKPVQNNNNYFVENPADARVKAEQRRFAKESRNTYGKSRGGDQNQSSSTNKVRNNKQHRQSNNHNRRTGSQMKKRQAIAQLTQVFHLGFR